MMWVFIGLVLLLVIGPIVQVRLEDRAFWRKARRIEEEYIKFLTG